VLQDGAVRAVGDQGLDRRLNRHGELLAGRRLRRRDAVGGNFDRLADQFEDTFGLRYHVAGDLTIQEAERCAPEETARSASVWLVRQISQFFSCRTCFCRVLASLCSVVPVSTATVNPQRLLRPVNVAAVELLA